MHRIGLIIEQLAKYGSYGTAAVYFVMGANGILNFQYRLILEGVGCVFLFVAASSTARRPPALSPVLGPDGNPFAMPQPVARRWIVFFVLALLILCLDSAINFGGYLPVAEIRGATFPPRYEFYATGNPDDHKRRTHSIAEFGPDCRAFAQLSHDEQTQLRERFDTLRLDFICPPSVYSIEEAQNLYFVPPHGHESFLFEIRKKSHVKELTIDDVEIVVESYYPVPGEGDTTHQTSASENLSVITVELKKLDCKELPWRFSATYLLDDINKKTVKEWDKCVVKLTGEWQQAFRVILCSGDTGIFMYRADLIVHPDLGPSKRIPLFDKPRTCAFSPRPRVRADGAIPLPPPPDAKTYP